MSKRQAGTIEPVAIIAIGAIYPGRGTTTGFWRDIQEGVDTFSDVPASHWLEQDYYDADPRAPDRTYGRRGAFISPQAFDPVGFGVPPNALDSTDTSQLLALIAAKQVMDEAEREAGAVIDRQRTSVILGVASATELTAHMAGRLARPAWVKGLREAGIGEDEVQQIADAIASNFAEWKESTFPGLLGNVIAGRIANRLDLGGSNYVTDAACASSLAAMQIAIHELTLGDSDMVLTGGVDTLNDILMYMCFSKTPALSQSGDIRPFSARSDGTMLGEGVGMMALRRLSDAERDGNRIHAVIRGLGGASDGRATAIYAPLASGQAKALTRAYEKAGYGPETVGLVEAHGTGTMAGDRTELEGLHAVFDPAGRAKAPWCALGSVKSQIGHTKAAAGTASVLKVVGALSRKVLPPTIKVEAPAAPLRGKTPFYLNTTSRPWIAAPDTPRRASVSSFGFGGSNFHVTLEEYTGPNQVVPVRVTADELVLLSAASDAELAGALPEMTDRAGSEGALARVASQSHAQFDVSQPVRAAIIASSPDDFAAKASRLADAIGAGRAGQGPLGAGLHYASGEARAGKLALLFAGQGSQYVGMGSDLAMAFPRAREVWDEIAGSPAGAGLKLHDLAFPPQPFDEEEAHAQSARLTQMQNAQPAIAAVTLAQLALLDRLGLSADMVAGHSFGEVMALHLAGVFDGEAALDIAVRRGRTIARVAEGSEGEMLALQADAQAAHELLAACGADLVIANDNAPGQVVLSGSADQIEKARAAAEAAGIKARRLPVATAFHSSIVAPAVAPFAKALKRHEFAPPRIPVFANATAEPYSGSTDAVAKQLSRQIVQPVRFRECLEAMHAAGASVFVEVGPGAVLSGLARNTLAGRGVTVLSLDARRERDTAAFLSAVGQLMLCGFPLDLAALYQGLPAEAEPPTAPKYTVEISGANYGKPYPPKGGAAALPAPNATTSIKTRHDQDTTQMTANGKIPHTPYTNGYGAPAHQPSEAGFGSVSQQIADGHSQFLQVMAQTHTAFLQAMSALAGTGTQPSIAPQPLQAPLPSPAPVPRPVPAAAAQPRAEMPAAPQFPGGTATAQPAAAPAPVPAVRPMTNGSADPLSLVTALVSEKTGYPEDMLDPDMDLEGELGVDSIKQVEILSTLRERLPAMPEVEPERLAELRTIRLVASFIAQQDAGAPAGDKQAVSAPNTALHPTAATAQPKARANAAITADTVRALIADKTGYPPELLGDDMDLEGELGIDSIKQVEILSALREAHPGLPEVEPEQMAEMRSIRKISDFFA